jgi:hypothetical protein
MEKPLIGRRPPKNGHLKVAALRQLEQQTADQRLDEYIARASREFKPIEIDYPIPAIRCWDIAYERNDELKSVAMNFYYDGPVTRETVKPGRRGERGFWAVKPRGMAILAGYTPDVLGIVELTGTVVEHEFGWRAEECTIQTLYTIAVLPSIRRSLEKRYQCDVYPISSVNSFMEICFR